MMIGTTGGLGALGGFRGFGRTIAQNVEDATTVFQDAFDAFEETPEALLPKAPCRKESSMEIPANYSQYQWSKLFPKDRRMIRLMEIEKIDSRGANSEQVKCGLLENTLSISQVKCNIFNEDLDSLSKEYVAISYSWLDMEANVPLVISDKEVLYVNPSLMACLQRLLKREEKMTLWWDNICVKQTEKDEDNEIASQVALMKDIFGCAKRTYIWLGENDEDSELALQTLNEICLLNGSENTSDKERKKRANTLVSEGFRDPESTASRKRTAIAKLLNRKYFERAWIYQEAVVSKEIVVLVGDRELNFDRLCHAVHAYCSAEGDKMRRTNLSLGNPLQIVAHGYNTLQAIRQGRAELQGKRAVSAEYLQIVLCRAAGSVRATREHDLVYAFLGFRDPRDETAPIKINYNQEVGAAYNDAALSLMKQTKNLDIFGICGGKETLKHLASWAPNWTIRLPQGQPIYQIGMRSPFDASKGMTFHFTPPKTETPAPKLVTYGRIIDTVAAVSGLDFKYAERNRLGIENFIRLQTHLDFLKKSSAGPWDRERVMQVILADGAFEYSRHIFDTEPTTQKQILDFKSLVQAYDNDRNIRQDKGGGLGLIDPLRDLKAAYTKLRKQSLICVRKMLFVSGGRYLGLAPETVSVGDKVAILNGSRVPLLLRKCDQNEEQPTYQLIGQTYFEGAMYGEKANWINHHEADEIVLV